MIKPLASTALLALALNLSACSTFDFDIGPSGEESVSTEAAAINAPASWVFGEQTDGQIAENWSSVLIDPRLDELITQALVNNPSLRSSAESIARSEALLRQSRSNLVPSLSADFSPSAGTVLEGGDFFDTYSGGLSASWEADLWGGIRAGILASGFDLASTRAAFESARQALIAAVARSYSLAIEADLQIDLSEQTLRAQEETFRIVNVRYELGAASRREVVLAESDVASAQDNLVVARSAKTDAIQALQILLGAYPSGELAIAPDFPTFTENLGAGTPEALLNRRPDVLSAEYDVLSAFQSTRVVTSDTLPILTLNGGIDTASGSIGDIFDPVSVALSLGARLADVLFDGGLSKARIDAASATQRQALADYGQAVLDAYFDVESALNTISILRERRVFVQQSADSARETLALAEIQYKEGDIDLIDVLTFRQRSFQADQTAITLDRQIIEARIALYLALGGSGFNEAAIN
ncbi:TolC family protein [Hellea sp.]|nr:TolC family protein [Hellea sp.]